MTGGGFGGCTVTLLKQVTNVTNEPGSPVARCDQCDNIRGPQWQDVINTTLLWQGVTNVTMYVKPLGQNGTNVIIYLALLWQYVTNAM